MKPARLPTIGVALTVAGLGASSALVSTPAPPQTDIVAPKTAAASAPAAIRHAESIDQPLPSLQLDLSAAGLSAGSQWTTLTVTPGDSLSVLFERAGVPATDWLALLELKNKVNALRHLRPGDVIRIRKTENGRLAALKYRIDGLHTLHVERAGGQFSASVVKAPTTIRMVRAVGRIRHSLASALQRAGASPGIAANLAQVFHWRIDLSRDIHKGDQFTVIYQQVYAHGRRVKSGLILAAKLKTDNQTLTAFRYTPRHEGDHHYYDQNGRSLQPSILRTPLHYTRVSSPFDLHRYHPILHLWRPHYGVDLAAPMGTPIKAAADGRVRFAGRDGGYGRLVILEHFDPYSTRYGHLSRFADGLHKGEFVHQGQVIGYVGASGEATGPHLHFEIRVNGVPKPPLKVKLPDGAPIPDTEIARYRRVIAPMLAQLKSAPTPGGTILVERHSPAGSVDTERLKLTSLHSVALLMSPHSKAAASDSKAATEADSTLE